MVFFEMHIFFGKMETLKNSEKNLQIYSFAIDFPVCTPVSSSQWTQFDACRLKTEGGVGFWVPEKVTFQESGCKVEKWIEGTNT